MAVTKLRGNSQIKDSSLILALIANDFLSGTDWNITNSANNATITGVRTPTSAKDIVPKDYVDGLVDSTLKAPDDYDASVNTYPTTYKGNAVSEGDTFYITVAGTMGTTVVNVGDLLVSKADVPGQTNSNWFVMESNRDQATESILGIAKIATQTIADAGTNDTDIITPLKLATYLGNAGIGALTFQNGITNTAGVVELGGTLTKATAINGANNSLAFNNLSGLQVSASTYFSMAVGSNNSNILVDGDEISIVSDSDGNGGGNVYLASVGGASLKLSDSGGEYRDSTTTGGLRYYADYSANFTARSLVDKGYVDAQISASSKLTHYSNELPTVTDGSAALAALSNLGSHTTDKVTNVEVYLNGISQAPGASNDYTLNALTGVITFTFNLATGDVVLVHYDSQDA